MKVAMLSSMAYLFARRSHSDSSASPELIVVALQQRLAIDQHQIHQSLMLPAFLPHRTGHGLHQWHRRGMVLETQQAGASSAEWTRLRAMNPALLPKNAVSCGASRPDGRHPWCCGASWAWGEILYRSASCRQNTLSRRACRLPRIDLIASCTSQRALHSASIHTTRSNVLVAV